MVSKEKKEDLELKAFIQKLISRWPWFVLFAVLGLLGGYLAGKMIKPKYSVTSTVLVEEQDNSMSKLSGLFGNISDDFKGQMTNNVDNMMGVLKTYTLSNEALEELNRKVTWYEDGFFIDHELYKEDPFVLEITDSTLNRTDGIPLKIKMLTENTYRISAHGYMNKNGFREKIDFQQNGTFGKEFSNRYCKFIIRKKTSYYFPGKNYYFKFNDLSDLTKGCLSRLKVELSDKKADIINITITGNNPAKEVDYLNKLNQELIRYRQMVKSKTSENSLVFIGNQLDGITDSLKKAQNRYTDFRADHKIIDLDEEAKDVLAKVNELETQKFQMNMQIDYFKNLKNYMHDADKMQTVATPSVVGIMDAGLNALVEKLIDLYSRRRTMAFSARDNNPGLKLIDEEIRATCKSMEDNIANLSSNAIAQLNLLNGQIKQINGKMSDFPETEQQYMNIKRQFDLNNDIYTFMLQKKAEIGITNASNVSDVQILDPARIETAEQTGPKPLLNLLIGLLAGLALPFIYLYLSQYLNNKIQGTDDIENDSEYPVIASIIHSDKITDPLVVRHLRSRITESFRQLRTQLKYYMTKPGVNVICIHSVMPGEGKTFTSLNLASIFALQGKRTLLIDADLRKAGLSDLVPGKNKPGLSDYLIGSNHLDESIRNIQKVDNLSFLPSGELPPNSAELLENGFSKLLKEVKEKFDCIVVDTSPTILTDSVIIGSQADVNLFVVRSGYSYKKQIEDVDNLVQRGMLKNAAYVLNDVRRGGKYGYGYGYSRYGYGYGYGYGKYYYGKHKDPDSYNYYDESDNLKG
ncbi:MAG: polysaccharide biosynthesis tyrosine autokinase [Bacteroidota bacterium]|nr:polysaccharide biosynthesis tyrosine autokinase [Bacteroidota bacterium]